jgi:mannitol-specific phosphotransferase system IIBC component
VGRDPNPRSTALYQKKRFIGRSQAHLQKGLTGVCTSTLVSYSITTSAMKTPENTDDLMTLNQKMQEISKQNTDLISCIA